MLDGKTIKKRISEPYNVEQIELKGFSRSVAELEWLILILVLLYFVAPGSYVADEQAVIIAMICFAVFVLAFRYVNLKTVQSQWKIALETWFMIGFITWILAYTGKIDSPLVNLYLLVIITSGLTLGKLTTLLEFVLITSIYLWLGYPEFNALDFNLADFTKLMIEFAPFLLIAYLVSMLSADLHFARQMFQHMSETDELTGLLNKRAFDKLSHREMAKSQRYGHSFSILMADADTLKVINDQYGHEAGDKLIRTIADTIQVNLRETDILARYGGDEFVIFLPETAPEQAREVADRVRDAVANINFMIHNKTMTVSVSIGMASYPQDSSSVDDILDRSDKALYVSKQAGRNCVTAFGDIPANA